MKLEIWSDVVCPWCYIGKRRFEAALERFEHRDEVTVRWRSFELDPDAPQRRELPSTAHLASKYGMTLEQAAASQQKLTGLAAAEGLDYHREAAVGGNSFDAHRLLQLARERGLQDALQERLMEAYFTDGDPIGDPEALARIAVGVGLEHDEVAELLSSDEFAEAVREDERLARQYGINGVPFFAIDDRYGISGAQPAELILSALEQAWREREGDDVPAAGS